MNSCSVKGEFEDVIEIFEPSGQFSGHWFLLKIKPLPRENIYNVISDLKHNRDVSVNHITRSVEHLNDCTQKHELSNKFSSVIDNLKDIEFKIAIRSPYSVNGIFLFDGQPMVFVIDPYINFQKYPLHLHLNRFVHSMIPTSICYTHAPHELGQTYECRVINSVRFVSIWLLAHLIWEQLGSTIDYSTWILDQIRTELMHDDGLSIFNPHGLCRCGSGKMFKDCHMDVIMRRKKISPLNKQMIIDKWDSHMRFEEQFRTHFLSKFNR